MAVTAEAVQFDAMAVEQKSVLVGEETEHPVDPLVGEFGDRAAAGTDEVPVVAPVGARFEAAHPFAELCYWNFTRNIAKYWRPFS